MNCFADQMAVIEGIRRVPLVSNRQLGRFSLRDIEMAAGQVTPGGEGNASGRKADQRARSWRCRSKNFRGCVRVCSARLAAAKRIDEQMRQEAGTEAAPTFEPLSGQLTKVDKLLRAQLAARPDAETTIEEAAAGDGPAARPNLKAISSREDAIRALDAVADFFRRAEPSSPVPLVIDRAKRLVSKSFLEVVEDIAPGGLDQARSVAGLRDGQ